MCPRFDSGSRHHEIEGSKCGSSSGVEHNLAKVGVAGSNPVFRSIFYPQTIISLKVNKTLRLLLCVLTCITQSLCVCAFIWYSCKHLNYWKDGFIVHKISFLCIMLLLCLAVFTFSGCGGSKDSSDSETDTTELPNNVPDTYNTAAVLNGNWAVVDQEITVNAEYSGDVSLNMYLTNASIIFSNTDIVGSRGYSSASILETWQIYREGDTLDNMEIVSINLENQIVNMIKSGADNWRCDMYDIYKTVMNIEILAENLIKVTARRIAVIDSGALSGTMIQYNTALTFRKKE